MVNLNYSAQICNFFKNQADINLFMDLYMHYDMISHFPLELVFEPNRIKFIKQNEASYISIVRDKNDPNGFEIVCPLSNSGTVSFPFSNEGLTKVKQILNLSTNGGLINAVWKFTSPPKSNRERYEIDFYHTCRTHDKESSSVSKQLEEPFNPALTLAAKNLTKEQQKEIHSFFDSYKYETIFEELYNYQLSLCHSIKLINRTSIIGFGCENEHLRAYFGKTDYGFFIKFKSYDKKFDLGTTELSELKTLIDNNNRLFESHIDEYVIPDPRASKEKKTPKKGSANSKPTKAPATKPVEKINRVLGKLLNQANAKTFTISDFKKLADWSYCTSFNDDGYIYTLPNGNKVECDSKSETKLLDYLIKKKLTLAIGGQELCIKYKTAYRKNVDYFPDVVILTKDNHIAIIEVKPVTAMSYHLNVEKYAALQSYCLRRGYEYMMVDPDNDYMTFDELKSMAIPKAIVNRVEQYLRDILKYTDDCLLEKTDIPILYSDFDDKYKKGEFELYLHALVIQKGWYNKFTHGFMVFEHPQKDIM